MPIPVIHVHDGHIDDLLSCLLLWLSPEVDLEAVAVINGDCYADQSFEALIKMATFLDLEGAEIAFSEDPLPNPYPDNWRRESYIINELPLFNENTLRRIYQQGKGRRAESAIADCLAHCRLPMTLVSTGPFTPIAAVLDQKPDLASKIAALVSMGGALNVKGNVEDGKSDGTAEWNLFADPMAAKFVLDLGIPITFIPLDVTEKLPVTSEFLSRLERKAAESRGAQLAHALWSLVKGFEYFFWDTMTAAAVIEPSLFSFKEMRIDISTQGRAQGRMYTCLIGGKKVKIATSLDHEAFQELLLSVFTSK